MPDSRDNFRKVSHTTSDSKWLGGNQPVIGDEDFLRGSRRAGPSVVRTSAFRALPQNSISAPEVEENQKFVNSRIVWAETDESDTSPFQTAKSQLIRLDVPALLVRDLRSTD
jgi:hypothetical protein